MKKYISVIIVAMAFFSTVNTANAGIFTIPLLTVAYVNLVNSDDQNVNACTSEPVRLVQHEDNNFSSEVSGCEYRANEDKYTVIKTL